MKLMEHAELIAGISLGSNTGDTFKQIEESGTVTPLNIYEMEDIFHNRILFAPERAYQDSLELVQIQSEVVFTHRDADTGQFMFYRVDRELMNYELFSFGQDENTSTPIRDHVMAAVMGRMLKQDPSVNFEGHAFPLSGDQLNRLVDVVPCGLSLTTRVNKAYTTRVVTIHVVVRLHNGAASLLHLSDADSVVLTDQGVVLRPALDEGVWECTIDPPESRPFWNMLQHTGPFDIAMLVPSVE